MRNAEAELACVYHLTPAEARRHAGRGEQPIFKKGAPAPPERRVRGEDLTRSAPGQVVRRQAQRAGPCARERHARSLDRSGAAVQDVGR
eukprot:5253818-Pyramimonas_sp.AAC.1